MKLKVKDTNTLTYPCKSEKRKQENLDDDTDSARSSTAQSLKKKRSPPNLCKECHVCGKPAPDHVHFGGE